MSFEDFGTIISLHSALKEKLQAVVDQRGILNQQYEIKSEVFHLAGMLFGVQINSFQGLLTEAAKFNEEFLDWVESDTRAQAQMSFSWISGTGNPIRDDFVAEYIVNPLRRLPGAAESAAALLAATAPVSRELSYQDFVTMSTMPRNHKFIQTDCITVPPVALVTRNDNTNILQRIRDAGDVTTPNTTWADIDTLYLIGRYEDNGRMRFELPQIAEYAWTPSCTLEFSTSVAGVVAERAAVPNTLTRIRFGTSATAPTFKVGSMIEHSFNFNTEVTVLMDQNHGVAANELVIIAIKGKFSLKQCGYKSLLSGSTMMEENTVGIPNLGFGSTFATGYRNCAADTQRILNTTFTDMYALYFTQAGYENSAAVYPLDATYSQPSRILYTLFGRGLPANNAVPLPRLRAIAGCLIKLSSILCGLGIYAH